MQFYLVKVVIVLHSATSKEFVANFTITVDTTAHVIMSVIKVYSQQK